MSLVKEFTKGIFKENPVFVIALGMCPLLAVSTSMNNALGMGAAATFVLVFSNALISLIKKFIPSKVRIPCYVVVIATFVTIVDLAMAGFTPALHKSLGIFIPLIVVNCIILGRAEAFASKNSLIPSILDGVGMGAGFTFALCLLAVFRETLGSNKFFDKVFIPGYTPASIMILAPGGFLVLGLLLAFFNWRRYAKGEKLIRETGCKLHAPK